MAGGPVITEKLTRDIAHLARLELTDAEVTGFTGQLGKILGYVESLQKVDVQNIEPLIQPFSGPTPLRDDRVVAPRLDHDGRPIVLGCAPDTLNDGYKVPPIL